MRTPIPSLFCGIMMVLSLVSTADASNIGFRYSLGLTTTGPTAGLYWISVPYVHIGAHIGAR